MVLDPLAAAVESAVRGTVLTPTAHRNRSSRNSETEAAMESCSEHAARLTAPAYHAFMVSLPGCPSVQHMASWCECRQLGIARCAAARSAGAEFNELHVDVSRLKSQCYVPRPCAYLQAHGPSPPKWRPPLIAGQQSLPGWLCP